MAAGPKFLGLALVRMTSGKCFEALFVIGSCGSILSFVTPAASCLSDVAIYQVLSPVSVATSAAEVVVAAADLLVMSPQELCTNSFTLLQQDQWLKFAIAIMHLAQLSS